MAVLCGPGGVGKSALARWWANEATGRFAHGQLYADLRGFGGDEPLDPGEVLAAFLRALGVAPERVPISLAEQTAMYRTVTASRSLLVVLDDAYSAGQVRPLLPAAGSGVLVTSRRRLVGLVPDGARLLEIAPLSARESVELLTRAVGGERISREYDLAEELAGICGGLPLALNVAAGRLVARPKLSVQGIVTELADEAGRLSRLSTLEGSSVRAMFDVSYRALSRDAARLYRALSLHPGPELGASLATTMVVADGGDRSGALDALDELLDASLLDEVAEDRFRFHDLLRLHAREMSDMYDSVLDQQAALRGTLEFYLAAARHADMVLTPYRRRIPYAFQRTDGALPEFLTRTDALAWLSRERANLIHAGRAALAHDYPELAWQLCDVMWPLLLYVKNYRDRLEIDERGVQAARAWGNVWAEADMLKRLSGVCARVGDYESAERHGVGAVDRYREAGDVPGSLDAREGLAGIYRDTGRVEQAERLLIRILAENRQLGRARNVGLTCFNLGTLLTHTGRPAEALPLFVEAKEIFGGLADVDPYNGARALIGLAGAYLGIGDIDGAEQAATEAAGRMTELGSDHERAEALVVLGHAARRRGAAHAARRHYREAMRIFDALGSGRGRELVQRLADLDRAGGGEQPAQGGSVAVPAADGPDSVERTTDAGEERDARPQ